MLLVGYQWVVNLEASACRLSLPCYKGFLLLAALVLFGPLGGFLGSLASSGVSWCLLVVWCLPCGFLWSCFLAWGRR